MLLEALHYARARLSGQKDAHGHLTQLVALWARLRRQAGAWAPHLERARALCLRAAKSCPPDARRTALVLGSGLLAEVPLEELAALFDRVVLADMAFLPAARARARALGNVELLTRDLSGCLDRLPHLAELAAQPAPQAPAVDLSQGLQGLDFVYSANLLSQLPLFVLPGLAALAPGLSESAQKAFAAALLREHLEALRRLPCPACLLTDVRERTLRQGRVETEEDLLFGQGRELSGEGWVWRFAPKGEERRGVDLERLVLGVPDVRAKTPGLDAAANSAQ